MTENPIVRLSEALKNKQSAVLATVIEIRGASPAKVGAHVVMLVDGSTVGTVGGGKLEAAILKEFLVNNHPFIDGNTRTRIACTVLFLRQNGIDFSAKNAELEKFTLRVASSRVKRSEIAKGLKNHSR